MKRYLSSVVKKTIFKPQRDITTLTRISKNFKCCWGDMIIRTLLFTASGNVKWYMYLENSLGVPYKVEHTFAAAAAKSLQSLQSCPTLQPHKWQPTRLRHPWDSPGKNTGVGCHFILQCMKVKSESEVAQSCLSLSNAMDCSIPGSSIHGIFQARVLELWCLVRH